MNLPSNTLPANHILLRVDTTETVPAEFGIEFCRNFLSFVKSQPEISDEAIIELIRVGRGSFSIELAIAAGGLMVAIGSFAVSLAAHIQNSNNDFGRKTREFCWSHKAKTIYVVGGEVSEEVIIEERVSLNLPPLLDGDKSTGGKTLFERMAHLSRGDVEISVPGQMERVDEKELGWDEEEIPLPKRGTLFERMAALSKGRGSKEPTLQPNYIDGKRGVYSGQFENKDGAIQLIGSDGAMQLHFDSLENFSLQIGKKALVVGEKVPDGPTAKMTLKILDILYAENN